MSLRPMIFVLLLTLLTAAAASGQSSKPVAPLALRESWYQIELDGASAGWMKTREGYRGENLVTEAQMHLELTRGQAVVKIETESRFVETQDGRPIEAWSRQLLGSIPIETSYEFADKHIVVTTKQGGESRRQEIAPPQAEWFPPAALERHLLAKIAAGAVEINASSVDPLLGVEPVTTHWSREAASEEVTTATGTYQTTRWRQSPSYAPHVVTIANIDRDGRLIKSVTPLMGLHLTAVLTSREAVAARPSTAPELLVRSFVKSERRIERPRQVRRAVYDLRLEGGELALPEVPTLAAQQAKPHGDVLRLVVELGSSPQLAEVNPEAFLKASTYISHDDPKIRQLLAKALSDASDPAAVAEPAGRAETLRAFVNGYLVEKNLNTLLATAAEVATTRSGDCTEHAVLLTALLRGDGIPARVVTGLIYAERFAGASQIFGYHMWSQALIDSRWVDLDATLAVSFDATHIAFSVSALDDERMATTDIARIGGIMGRLRIRVVEVGY